MAVPEFPFDPASQPPPARAWYARRSAWVATAIALVLLLAGLWWWLHRTTDASGPGRDPNARALPVVAAPVTQGSIDIYLTALGTVTPRNMVTVHSRVDGQLMQVAFREGQLVKAGELLAEIDPRPFDVQLTQAQGQMAKDQALLKNAQLDLERYRTLLAQDSIAKQQVDTQESLVRQYQGAVQADQGADRQREVESDVFTRHGTDQRSRRPAPGRPRQRDSRERRQRAGRDHADPANHGRCFRSPRTTLQQVLKRLKSGADAARRSLGSRAKSEARHGKARHRRQPDRHDDRHGEAARRVCQRRQRALSQSVRECAMLVETRQDATLLPTAAVQRGAPGTFVYAVNDDRSVSVKPVKLGPVQGEITAVESGIAPGATVVVDGADKLREGAKVELISREALAAPAAGAPQRDKGNKAGGERAPGERRKSGS